MLKKKGTSKISYLQSSNQNNQFLMLLHEVIIAAMFVLNSISLMLLTESLGTLKMLLMELAWEKDLQNEDTLFVDPCQRKPWLQMIWKISQDVSTTLQTCHSWQMFVECLFSKALVVNIDQSHLVFDWSPTWLFLIPFILSFPDSMNVDNNVLFLK